MTEEMRCRQVQKLIHTMPRGGCEDTLRRISAHLSECEPCRELLAASRRAEELLAVRKLRLDELAARSPITKSQALAKIPERPGRSVRRLRVAWAGACLIALLLGLAAIRYFVSDNGDDYVNPPVAVSGPVPSAPVTRAKAEEAAASILQTLAEVELRYQAPPPRLLGGIPDVPWEPPRSRLFEQCTLESARTLVAVAESETNLTWRNGS